MLEVVLNKCIYTEPKYKKHRPNQKHNTQLIGCLLVKWRSNKRLNKALDATSVTTTATTNYYYQYYFDNNDYEFKI